MRPSVQPCDEGPVASARRGQCGRDSAPFLHGGSPGSGSSELAKGISLSHEEEMGVYLIRRTPFALLSHLHLFWIFMLLEVLRCAGSGDDLTSPQNSWIMNS